MQKPNRGLGAGFIPLTGGAGTDIIINIIGHVWPEILASKGGPCLRDSKVVFLVMVLLEQQLSGCLAVRDTKPSIFGIQQVVTEFIKWVLAWVLYNGLEKWIVCVRLDNSFYNCRGNADVKDYVDLGIRVTR